MDMFEIVVSMFVGVASIAVVAGFVAMLVSSDRRPGGRRHRARIAPGWYPDAKDESLLRYFDGRVPTGETSRRSPS